MDLNSIDLPRLMIGFGSGLFLSLIVYGPLSSTQLVLWSFFRRKLVTQRKSVTDVEMSLFQSAFIVRYLVVGAVLTWIASSFVSSQPQLLAFVAGLLAMGSVFVGLRFRSSSTIRLSIAKRA